MRESGSDSITVLVATGLHRPNEGEELRELIGSEWVLERVRVVNHFAKNDDDHVDLGATSGGLPVRLDRRFVACDMRIVIGLVEPHFMAGYSGGRKVIVPGIAHSDTIRALHSTRLLARDNVANCRLSGNPVHEEQMRAVRMLGKCFAVNTVIDENRDLSFVNFGAIEESHTAAVGFAGPYFEIPLEHRFGTVITTAAGYPLDQNYYQTVKGMVGVVGMIEPDSDIFIVSECSAGLGTPEYAEAQARLVNMGVDRFLDDASQREYALYRRVGNGHADEGNADCEDSSLQPMPHRAGKRAHRSPDSRFPRRGHKGVRRTKAGPQGRRYPRGAVCYPRVQGLARFHERLRAALPLEQRAAPSIPRSQRFSAGSLL